MKTLNILQTRFSEATPEIKGATIIRHELKDKFHKFFDLEDFVVSFDGVFPFHYLMCPDDDLVFENHTTQHIEEELQELIQNSNNVLIAAPRLSFDSYCSWPFVQKTNSGACHSVEPMCPIFHYSILTQIVDEMKKFPHRSGWGFEAMFEDVIKKGGGTCWMLNARVQHIRPLSGSTPQKLQDLDFAKKNWPQFKCEPH